MNLIGEHTGYNDGFVLPCAGLSSSAALQVVAGTLFVRFNDLGIDGTALALIGQEAENVFVGINCGNMDQLISVLDRLPQPRGTAGAAGSGVDQATSATARAPAGGLTLGPGRCPASRSGRVPARLLSSSRPPG